MAWSWEEYLTKLPSGYMYHLVEECAQIHQVTYQVSVTTEEEAEAFLQEMKRRDKMEWRIRRRRQPNKALLFGADLVCHHGTAKRKKSTHKKTYVTKTTDCEAMMRLKLHQKTAQKCHPLMHADYPLLVEFQYMHNHETEGAAVLKYRDVPAHTRHAIEKLLLEGCRPAEALASFKETIKKKCNDTAEYLEVCADRSQVPDYSHVKSLGRKLLKGKLGKPRVPVSEIPEALRSHVLMDSPQRLEATASPESFVAAFASPLMIRGHQLREAGELVFLDAYGCTDLDHNRVFLLVTNSAAGGIILGGFVTNTDTTGTVESGLRLLCQLLGKDAFNGRGDTGPAVFMTDDCKSVHSALATVFPSSRNILCTFHVADTMGIWLRSRENDIDRGDRQRCADFFSSLIYSETKEDFDRIWANSSPLLEKYAHWRNHLESHYLPRRTSWALCERTHLPLRGDHMVNYVGTSFQLLIDGMQRQQRHNAAHLIQSVLVEFDTAVSSQILEVALGRECLKGSTADTPDTSSVLYSAVLKVSDSNGIYQVQSSSRTCLYRVNAFDGMCTCPKGFGGAKCKHQELLLERGLVEQNPNFFLKSKLQQRAQLHRLATGDHPVKGFMRDDPSSPSSSSFLNEEVADSVLNSPERIGDFPVGIVQLEVQQESGMTLAPSPEAVAVLKEQFYAWSRDFFSDITTDIDLAEAVTEMFKKYDCASIQQKIDWFSMLK